MGAYFVHLCPTVQLNRANGWAVSRSSLRARGTIRSTGNADIRPEAQASRISITTRFLNFGASKLASRTGSSSKDRVYSSEKPTRHNLKKTIEIVRCLRYREDQLQD
jgi:hypothetical protein